MRRLSVLTAVLIFACEDSGSKQAEAPADKPAETADSESGFDALKTVLAEASQAGKDAKQDERRKACIRFVDALGKVTPEPEQAKKLERIESDARGTCPEIFETKRLLKDSDPSVNMALSGGIASLYKKKDLVTGLKKAKKTVKRGEDPAKTCAELRVAANVLVNKKNRKVKKLAKKALAFCDGPGRIASIRFHLKATKEAIEKHEGAVVADHCLHAVKTMHELDEEKRAKVSDDANAMCFEALALVKADGAESHAGL